MRFAYLFDTDDGQLDENRRLLSQFNPDTLVVESPDMEATRPRWHQMLGQMENGSELVVLKLSNALRGLNELSFFLGFCRSRMLRVISIQDSLDFIATSDRPGQFSSLLDCLSRFPQESSEIREKVHSVPLTLASEKYASRKSQKHSQIINMYTSRFTTKEIIKATDISGPAVIYQTLEKYGIPLRRHLNTSRSKKYPTKPSEMHKMVIDEFNKGRTIAELTSLTGYARSTITYILKEGSCLRPREQSRLRHSEVINLHEKGTSLQEISRITGYEVAYIRRIIKKAGCQSLDISSCPPDCNNKR